jgi:2-amino-4-hydroxy-6-hydroxymethyldihydropteridine diphosphokinase
MSKKMNVLIAFGSNVSDDQEDSMAVILNSIELLVNNSIKKPDISQFYKTPAFPVGAGPDFINCVLAAETQLAPDELLSMFHEIEAILGRKREKRWGQRVIDIDLLNYENFVKPSDDVVNTWINMALTDQMERTPEHLILPHPRIQDRAFVLVPMADVAPEWRHPVLGKTTVEMRDALPDALLHEIRIYRPNL